MRGATLGKRGLESTTRVNDDMPAVASRLGAGEVLARGRKGSETIQTPYSTFGNDMELELRNIMILFLVLPR